MSYANLRQENGLRSLKMAILTSTTRPAAEDHLELLLKKESRQTSRELAQKMNCDQKTILNHLHSMGFAEKLRVWVPHHELSENNKENYLQIAFQRLARHRATHGHKQRFLYRIVAGDEKWCLYINMKQRKEWVAPVDTPKPRVKPDLHPRKTMICVMAHGTGKYSKGMPRSTIGST